MNRDWLMGSTAQPALPLGPAVIRFQPGDRVVMVWPYSSDVLTVAWVAGTGPRATVRLTDGTQAWAQHLEKV